MPPYILIGQFDRGVRHFTALSWGPVYANYVTHSLHVGLLDLTNTSNAKDLPALEGADILDN